MPRIAVIDSGHVELADLDVSQLPIGTVVRTVDGDYYRLANSTAALSVVRSLAAPANTSAIAKARKASAANEFTLYAKPDVPRKLSVTTDGTGWDGGAITFQGFVGGLPYTELVTPLTVAGTIYTEAIFEILSAAPTKGAVGSTSTAVSLGVADAFATNSAPGVVAVRDNDTLRWLYANSEVMATALAGLWTFSETTGRYVQGACASLQDLVDANDSLLRNLIASIRAGKTNELMEVFDAVRR